MVQTLHYRLFLFGECKWVGWINGREVCVSKLIFLAVKSDSALCIINIAKLASVKHLPFWVALENLCLSLELKNCNRLVHHSHEAERLLVEAVAVLGIEYRTEHLARVVVVMLHSVCSKRHEVDAVAVLESGEVGVSQRESNHVAYTSIVTGRSSHPQNVVVPPLYVPRMILREIIHYDVRTRTTVVHVAEDMQLVD